MDRRLLELRQAELRGRAVVLWVLLGFFLFYAGVIGIVKMLENF